MSRVLLIEDSEDVQALVTELLSPQHEVICANSASEVMALLEKQSFELVLLDVVLPDMDGFRLCLKIKNHPRMKGIPILFLTGKTAISDKITGFSLGADDYIIKPFDPLELRVRVDARLNKAKEQQLALSPSEPGVIIKGELKINLAYQKVFLIERERETDIDLSPVEFKLLYHFVSHEEHVLSRDQLMTAARGENVTISDRTIDKHVSSLRRKLASRSFYIQTVAGEGYRFSLVEPKRKRKAA